MPSGGGDGIGGDGIITNGFMITWLGAAKFLAFKLHFTACSRCSGGNTPPSPARVQYISSPPCAEASQNYYDSNSINER